MRVAVPKETGAGERRVALVPDSVGRLAAAGFDDRGRARRGRRLPGSRTASTRAAGADVVARGDLLAGAEAVVRVAAPTADGGRRARAGDGPGRLPLAADGPGRDRASRRARRRRVRDGVDPAHHAGAVDGRALVAEHGRRLQGGRSLAADRLPRLFPLLMTAAGTVAPGEGARARRRRRRPAGDRDRAAARRRRLGLRRPAGGAGAGREPGRDLPRSRRRGEETEGGYARELTPEEQARQQAALEERMPEFDVVITTALVPGRPAPKLIPADGGRGDAPRLRDRRPRRRDGRQLRADRARRRGRRAARRHDRRAAPTSPRAMPYHASQLYARNVTALLHHLAPERRAGARLRRRDHRPAPA